MNIIAGLFGLIAGLVREAAPTVAEVLDAASVISASAGGSLDGLEEITVQVKKMVEEGRDPTTEEIEDLRARVKAAKVAMGLDD